MTREARDKPPAAPPIDSPPMEAVYPRCGGPRPLSTPSPGRDPEPDPGGNSDPDGSHRTSDDGPDPARLIDEPEGDLVIGVDFDGVLFDHVPYVLRGFRDAHGIDLREEDVQYWDFFQYRAVREEDLTWSCVRSVLREIETDEALHRTPPLDDDAPRVMGAWRDRGHRVEVVTARDPESREATEVFLEANGVPHDDLEMGVSRKLGYDVLVDDSPHNALLAAADGTLALLMDQPYNRDVPDDRNPLRVNSWAEVETRVAVHPITLRDPP